MRSWAAKFVRLQFAAALCALPVCVFSAIVDVPPDGDIAAAVAAAEAGDVVQLAAGEYVLAAEVRIEAGVTVRGAGRLLTTVKSDGAPHRLFFLNHAGAVLSDLTAQDAVTSGGAAVYVNRGTVQDAIVRNCRGGNGAGIYLENGTVRRCVLTGNSGNWGGGIYPHGTCRVESVLAYGNTASYGGGIYTENTSRATIVNCTFAENSATSSGHDFYNYTTATRVYNTYLGKTAGGGYTVKSGCFDSTSAPGFVVSSSGVFLLTSDSAMLAAGVTVPDADGGPAEADVNGNPLPATPASGACQPIDETAPIVPAEAEVPCGGTVDVTVHYPDEAKGGTGTLIVVNPDGTTSSQSAADGATVQAAAAQAGTCSLMLVVEKDGATVVSDLYAAFVTGFCDVYVDPNAANPVEPYATPATAAATIEAAIPFVLTGGTVHLAEGEYATSATLTIGKGFTILGAGPNKTFVVAAGNVRLFALHHAAAKIADLTLRGTGSSSDMGGKAVHFSVGGLLENCLVEEFISTAHGGAVTCADGSSGRISRCVFRNNKANWGGAVYVAQTGRIDIRNSLFYGNLARWGAAAYADGLGTLVNCTLYDNVPEAVSYGEFCRCNANFGVTNCIFGSVSWYTGGTSLCANNLGDSTSLPDPGFRDAANHDYRLAPSASATLDQGDDAAVLPDETDLLGRERIVGDHVDLGCYEFCDDEFVAGFEIVGTASAVGDTVTLVPTVMGGNNPVNRWRVVNLCGGADVVGETRGNDDAGAFEATIPGPGVYSIFYSVTDGENEALLSKSEAFVVQAAGDVYVAESGTPVAPFDTPETAATNMTAAFRILPGNATLHLLEGTHLVTRRLTVDGGRKVVGAGPGKTVVTPGLASDHGVFALNGASSVISGLTITGTAASAKYMDGGGGGVRMTAGLLEDVSIANLLMPTIDGSAIYATGGRISRVEMRGCTGNGGNYGVFTVEGKTAVDNTLVCDCEGGWGSTVYVTGGNPTFTNCTFVYRSGKMSTPMYSASAGVKFVNCNFDCRVYMPSDQMVTDCFYGCNFSGEPRENHFEENGNLNMARADVLYADFANGNFRLKAKSPLRKAGIYAPWRKTATDLDGAKRTAGSKVDVGCYQRPLRGTAAFVR